MLARSGSISLKSAAEIELIAESGRIVKKTLDLLSGMIKPGISTLELDQAAEECIRSERGEPAFLGFQGYPASICASINAEVVNGIPSAKKLVKNGDIVSVDVGVKKNGFYGDAAVTVGAGQLDDEAAALIEVTSDVLRVAIQKVVAGNRIGDISQAIQQYVERRGYSVVRDFVGHGIGSRMHEPPQIPNFGLAGRGQRLKVGMVLAIEPMVNIGGFEVETLPDNWTVVTRDRKLSAHFEHSVAVTKDGSRVLTC